MSKYGIFMVGMIVGAVVTAVKKGKGREDMGNTVVTNRPKFQRRVKSPEEQLLNKRLFNAILKSDVEFVELQADEEGNIIVDKEKEPDLYDWVVKSSISNRK
jgi:hypothetical protein